MIKVFLKKEGRISSNRNTESHELNIPGEEQPEKGEDLLCGALSPSQTDTCLKNSLKILFERANVMG